MKNRKDMPAMVEPMERKPELRITIPPGKKSLAGELNGLKIGKRVTLEVTGKIVALNMDSYESSARVEITSMDCSSGMDSQVEEVRESRKGY